MIVRFCFTCEAAKVFVVNVTVETYRTNKWFKEVEAVSVVACSVLSENQVHSLTFKNFPRSWYCR